MGKLGTQVQDLPFPGVGRMILVFLLVVALAFLALYLLRRFLPTRFFPGRLLRQTEAARIRSLDRAALSATLTVHLVEVDGEKFFVAQGSSGIAVSAVRSSATLERN